MLKTLMILWIGLTWLTTVHSLVKMSSNVMEYIGEDIPYTDANLEVVEKSSNWIDVQYTVDENVQHSFMVWSSQVDESDPISCPPTSSNLLYKQETYSCRVDRLQMCTSYDLYYVGIAENDTTSENFGSVLKDVFTLPDEDIGPANLTCSTPSPGTLTVTWVDPFPEECPVSFEVSWEAKVQWDPDLSDMNSTSINATFYTLEQTIPGSEYSIDVTATFQGNNSGETASITCTTLPEQSSPPNLTVADTGTTFLYLTWESPEVENGMIESYRINWTDEEGISFDKTIGVQNDFNLTEKVFACSGYNISLAAENGAGWGVWDTQSAYTLQADISNIVSEDVSDTSMVISWTAAPANCNRANTTVSWLGESLWDDYSTQGSVLLQGSVSSQPLTDLYPYSQYDICVTMMADWAEAICTSSTTKQGVPDAPGFIEISSTKSSIYLSWNETTVWYGIPSHYLVTCPDAGITENVDANTTEHTITDLSEGTDYTVSVQACNEEQCSSATQSMETTAGKPHSNTGLIVGLTVGLVAVLAIVAAFVVRSRRKRRDREDDREPIPAEIDSNLVSQEEETILSNLYKV